MLVVGMVLLVENVLFDRLVVLCWYGILLLICCVGRWCSCWGVLC